MATINESLDQILSLDGAITAAIVDYTSGLTLASRTNRDIDPEFIELVAASNSEVVKAMLRTIEQVGTKEIVEDILITLNNSYYLIRMSPRPELANLFFFVALDKNKGNLGLARRVLGKINENIDSF